jgi:hypothetical protein
MHHRSFTRIRIAALAFTLFSSAASADTIMVSCEVKDCLLCNDIKLSIQGGPGGVSFSNLDGRFSIGSVYSSGTAAGQYQFSCSWTSGGRRGGCSGSINLGGAARVIINASSTNCQSTTINAF